MLTSVAFGPSYFIARLSNINYSCALLFFIRGLPFLLLFALPLTLLPKISVTYSHCLLTKIIIFIISIKVNLSRIMPN